MKLTITARVGEELSRIDIDSIVDLLYTVGCEQIVVHLESDDFEDKSCIDETVYTKESSK